MRVETPAEQLLFSTLRIKAESSVGTGCIVQHAWADGQEGPFLVTNKHVVQGTRAGEIRFTHSEGAGTSAVPALGTATTVHVVEDAWRWTEHPLAHVDIAVMPLAPVLGRLAENGTPAFYRSIPTSLIPDRAALEELDAVEEVLFVGYPNNVYDSVNNLPVTRRGSTATPPSIDYEGKPIFLIDASVFPGSSGSPVLIYNRGTWSGRKGVTLGHRVLFLGVLGAVLYREADGSLDFREIPAAVKPVVTTREMIDLGVVFKARTVIEAIEHLLRQRSLLRAPSRARRRRKASA